MLLIENKLLEPQWSGRCLEKNSRFE